MSTTPSTPAVAAQSWLKTHERIVIVALVLMAGSWGFSRYADLRVAQTEARANAAEQALSAQKATNLQNQATVAQVQQQYAAIVQSLQAQNNALALAVASRQAAVVAQQHTDATLALPDLANRLKTLGGAPDGSVSSTEDYVQFTQSGAVAVAQTLETIPALQGDLKDQQALTATAQAAQAQGDKVIASQDTEIAGLKLTIGDEEAQCKDQIAAVKAQGRKDKIKWFRRGVFVGFITGLFAGHAAGY